MNIDKLLKDIIERIEKRDTGELKRELGENENIKKLMREGPLTNNPHRTLKKPFKPPFPAIFFADFPNKKTPNKKSHSKTQQDTFYPSSLTKKRLQ